MKQRKLELSSVNVDNLIAISANGVHYFWHGIGERDYIADMKIRDEYERQHDHKIRAGKLFGVNADYSSEHAFIFYVADCYDPPAYLIFGDNWQDAHETFITEFEHLMKIEEPDLADYDEDYLSYNDNGTPVNTESVQYIGVAELRLNVKMRLDNC